MKYNNSYKQTRKQYLDVLRAFATIGVIFIHVSANNWYGYIGSANWITFSIYEGLFKVSVPIFFMISGCLFLNSNKEKSVKELFSHSIFRLLIFLIFWSIVYKLVQFPQNELSLGKNIQNILMEILKGDTQSHLWFVYAIIGMYLIVPLLRSSVQNSERKTLLYIIVICIVLGSICDFTTQFTQLDILSNNLNKIKSGFSVGYIGYFLLGAYIDKYDIKPKQRLLLYILGFIGTLTTIILVIKDCISTQTINERFWSYTMPGLYLSSIAVFLAIKNLNYSDGILLKTMTGISKKSLGIYGIHFLFIIILWKAGLTTFSFVGVLSVPVISMIVLGASFISSTLIGKMPFCGKYLA